MRRDLHNDTYVSGWQSPRNERGTWDIVQSCALTIFLCTYTAIFLNVKPDLKRREYIWYKVKWVLFTLYCPEIVTAMAFEQWKSAKQSMLDMKRMCDDQQAQAGGNEEKGVRITPPESKTATWSSTHGFLADAGGIHLKFPDSNSFPVNSYQLRRLVEGGHIPYPSIERKTILDKNKADMFARVVTTIQVIWFTVQCVARGAQGLRLTTLELLTLAFAVCAFHAVLFWQDKPLDVDDPVVLDCSKSLNDVLYDFDQPTCPANEYTQTPLDFLEPGPRFSYVIPFFKGMAWTANIWPIERTSPVSTFPNTVTVLPGGLTFGDIMLGWLLVLMYYGIHFAAWNFAFPTPIEELMWRIAAVMQAATVTLFVLACWPGNFLSKYVFGTQAPYTFQQAMDTPRWLSRIWAIPIIAMYLFARAYIVVEGFVSLRTQPAVMFRTVNWWGFIPHI